jgi:hypothetical protein
VRGADPGTSGYRDNHLGNHRQVDPNDVALAHAALLQRVRQALHLAQELIVGNRTFLALFSHPLKRDPGSAAGVDVPIDTVVGDVQHPVGEPLVERRIGVVEDRRERDIPLQATRLLGPERVRIPLCVGVCRRLAEGAVREGGRRRRKAILAQQLFEPMLELPSRKQRLRFTLGRGG